MPFITERLWQAMNAQVPASWRGLAMFELPASETLIAFAAGIASASTGIAFAQGGIIAVMIMGSSLAVIPFIAVLLYSYRLEVKKSEERKVKSEE